MYPYLIRRFKFLYIVHSADHLFIQKPITEHTGYHSATNEHTQLKLCSIKKIYCKMCIIQESKSDSFFNSDGLLKM